MPKITLSNISIRNLKIPEVGQVTYYDKNLPGFNVRVSQGGTKTYSLVSGTTRSRITLGRVGIISLVDARKEAKQILAENTLGKNRPKMLTYQDARDVFLEESEVKNKEPTTREYRRHFDTHFRYGRTPLTEITQQDIKKRLTKLNNRPSEKRHAFVAIRRLMRWCVANQYLTHNPTDGIKVETQKPRERVLSPVELKTMLKRALEQKTMFDSIVALLILTGQRRGEIGALEWDWVQDNQITLPEWITKNGRVHVFPVGELAQKVISQIPRKHNVFVFPARVGGRIFNGWSKSKVSFDKEHDVGGYTLHDLRETVTNSV